MSEFKEHPIKIDGHLVSLHQWGLEEGEVVYSFKPHVDAVENKLNDLYSAAKPLLIGISGIAGSGKSVLAEVLKSLGNNVELITIKKNTGAQKANLIPKINCKSTTYVIDNCQEADSSSLKFAAENHTEKGGVIVLIARHRDDIWPNFPSEHVYYMNG